MLRSFRPIFCCIKTMFNLLIFYFNIRGKLTRHRAINNYNTLGKLSRSCTTKNLHKKMTSHTKHKGKVLRWGTRIDFCKLECIKMQIHRFLKTTTKITMAVVFSIQWSLKISQFFKEAWSSDCTTVTCKSFELMYKNSFMKNNQNSTICNRKLLLLI